MKQKLESLMAKRKYISFKDLSAEKKQKILNYMRSFRVDETCNHFSISKKTMNAICEEKFTPKSIQRIEAIKKEIDIYKLNLKEKKL